MVFLARKETFRPFDLKVILALLWVGALARKVTSFLLAMTIVLKTQRCWLLYESAVVSQFLSQLDFRVPAAPRDLIFNKRDFSLRVGKESEDTRTDRSSEDRSYYQMH